MSRFRWTDQAKGELRKIERQQAMNILLELTRYGTTGQGDVKRLKNSDQYRLRVTTVSASWRWKTARCESCAFATARMRTADR